MEKSENKFYLKKAKLIQDRENQTLYYRLLYSNGITKLYDYVKFEKDLKIDIELKS
jgi:hypothetical protein